MSDYGHATLFDAVKSWVKALDGYAYADFGRHWRSNPGVLRDLGEGWWEWPAECDELLDGFASASENLLASASLDDQKNDLIDLLGLRPGCAEDLRQLIQLMLAMVSAIRAAAAILRSGWHPQDGALPGPGRDCLVRSVACYANAWPLRDHCPLQGAPARGSISRAEAALQDAMGGNDKAVCASTWLTVRRLLSFLLGDPEPDPQFQNRAQLLLVQPSGAGEMCPVQVGTVPEGRLGFYPDPLTLGATVVDEHMRNSMALAWKVCRASMEERLAHSRQPVAIRLAPHAHARRPL